MKKINLDDILSTKETIQKKVGYVAIIGRPNVGKSTFINTLIGEKISIVSKSPQTTQKKILAIYNDSQSQIIFFDTPGIHKNQKIINQKINSQAISCLKQVNIILYFIDSSRDYGKEEKEIEKILEFTKSPIIKVFTKIDLGYIKISIPKDGIKISSIDKTGFEDLISKIKSYLPLGELFYSEDYYTDQDIYFRIGEIIREKIFEFTKDEIPYGVNIKVNEIEETDNLIKIQSYIYTQTESQKIILIGKNANLLTSIGTKSRLELEQIFNKKVFLSLRVKKIKKHGKQESKKF